MKKIKNSEHFRNVIEKHGCILLNRRFPKKGFEMAKFDHFVAALHNCSFKKSQLQLASFCGIGIKDTSFRKANLSDSSFRCSELIQVDFRGAHLDNARFQHCHLKLVSFKDVDLRTVNFRNANFEDVDFHGAKMPKRLVELPELGHSFTAWKKVEPYTLLELEIPADAQRVSGWTEVKCRASAAKVVAAYKMNPNTHEFDIPCTTKMRFWSGHDVGFEYRVGEIARATNFNGNPLIVCAPGIHFFMNRKEAEMWQ